MEKVDFLPVGSVVIIKGSIRKTMIIGRGLMTLIDNEPLFFDYGGCMYPDGITGDQILYFNHQDIEEIIFRGFEDEENGRLVKNLQNWMEQSDAKHGNPYDINLKNQKGE